MRSRIIQLAGVAAISALTINQRPALATPEVHRFICSSGTAQFFQDQPNGRFGFGRTPWFLRCTTPDFAGETVGLDINGFQSRSGFDIINIVFEDDGSSIPNVTARFCFQFPDGSIVTVDKPFSDFLKSKIPNTRLSESFLSKTDFADPVIKRGSAALLRVRMLVKSGGKQHTITFGRSVIETGTSTVDPKVIDMEDEGCAGLDPCALIGEPPPPIHHHHDR